MSKGTKEGTKEEIKFVKKLNKKHDLKYWKTIELDSSNHYAVRVISKKYGRLNDSKILPKADAFIAKGYVDKTYLISNDYFLDESHLDKFNLYPVNNSGISIKRPDSKKYQIMKISPSTFIKVFKSNILASGASVYCKKEDEFIKNHNILNGWAITENDFIDYFNKKLNINIKSIIEDTSKEKLKIIKSYSNDRITEIINTNKDISDFIFYGIGNFEEPYTATWIFEHGKFKKNHIAPFSVTTGSGRSKGIYTIVIKPKN